MDRLTATPQNLTATVGVPLVNTGVASFTDGNLFSQASDFTATIYWGDNSNSTGAEKGVEKVSGRKRKGKGVRTLFLLTAGPCLAIVSTHGRLLGTVHGSF